jgi:hypothetical protein
VDSLARLGIRRTISSLIFTLAEVGEETPFEVSKFRYRLRSIKKAKNYFAVRSQSCAQETNQLIFHNFQSLLYGTRPHEQRHCWNINEIQLHPAWYSSPIIRVLSAQKGIISIAAIIRPPSTRLIVIKRLQISQIQGSESKGGGMSKHDSFSSEELGFK